MNPFIRVTELWLPTQDRSQLLYGGGLYGPLADFKAVSQETRFGFGEGLPGMAWAERKPIILKDLENSYFRRGAAARAAGLTCGIALPIFAGDFLLAVVVFFCGSESDYAGAIETWMNDPTVSGQMARVDGYYGGAQLFERDSGSTYGKGHGLSGMTWQTGVPIFVQDFYRSTRLLRPDDAVTIGRSTGIGFPFHHDRGRDWVVTLLSAVGTPIARRFEVWLPSDDLQSLQRLRILRPEEAGETGATTLGRAEGRLGAILITGQPFVSENLAQDAPLDASEIESEGLTAMVAIPCLTGDGRLAAVAAWYF